MTAKYSHNLFNKYFFRISPKVVKTEARSRSLSRGICSSRKQKWRATDLCEMTTLDSQLTCLSVSLLFCRQFVGRSLCFRCRSFPTRGGVRALNGYVSSCLDIYFFVDVSHGQAVCSSIQLNLKITICLWYFTHFRSPSGISPSLKEKPSFSKSRNELWC